MKSFENIKPIKRSRYRIILGKLFYTYKRYFEWYFGSKVYAKVFSKNVLSVVVFSHKSPLYRELREVDMWMQHNKVINLKIAVDRLNRVIIKPGETFSYWKLIGKPSEAKGYVDGMELYYGKVKTGLGGGLCQLSNLIYWTTLHTPLQVTERYRHSYDVFPDSKRTQPFGSGATCVYNYRDLQIYNGTDNVYQLNINITNEHLIGEWRTTDKQLYTYEVYEKAHKITHEIWGGYVRHNLIHRKIYDRTNNLVDDEYIAENHALMMYEPLLASCNEV